MNAVPRETRIRNFVTLILLILFACGLCAYVLVSMRIHAARQQAGNATPPPAYSY